MSIRIGGDYYYDPPPAEPIRDLLFIAGGIGINPILSMIRHHAFLQTQRNQSSMSPVCQLLYSARNRSDLVFHVSILVALLSYYKPTKIYFKNFESKKYLFS